MFYCVTKSDALLCIPFYDIYNCRTSKYLKALRFDRNNSPLSEDILNAAADNRILGSAATQTGTKTTKGKFGKKISHLP